VRKSTLVNIKILMDLLFSNQQSLEWLLLHKNDISLHTLTVGISKCWKLPRKIYQAFRGKSSLTWTLYQRGYRLPLFSRRQESLHNASFLPWLKPLLSRRAKRWDIMTKVNFHLLDAEPALKVGVYLGPQAPELQNRSLYRTEKICVNVK